MLSCAYVLVRDEISGYMLFRVATAETRAQTRLAHELPTSREILARQETALDKYIALFARPSVPPARHMFFVIDPFALLFLS